MNDLKHVSRDRLEQIEEDAREAAVLLPPPASLREKKTVRDAKLERRRRGEEL